MHSDGSINVGENDIEVVVGNRTGRSGPMEETQMDALRREVVHQAWLERLIDEFNAVGNDTRLRILYILWRCHEVRVNDLATILLLTAPAISQQLKKLHEQSLVQKRRVAQTIYYRLNPQSPLVRWLIEVFEQGVRSRILMGY